MAIIATAVFAITTYLSYLTSLEQERNFVEFMADERAHTFEAVLTFDQRESSDFPGGSLAATLSQFRESHEQVVGFGRTGEYVLARRRGEQIEFLVERRFEVEVEQSTVPWGSELAAPMRRALSGEHGSMMGLDYRNVLVMAGYAPIAGSDLGVVVKIDLSEVREPFIKRTFIVGVLSALIIALGAYAFYSITNPVLQELVDSERRLAEAQRIASMGNWEWDIQTGVISWSKEIFRIFGLRPGEFEPTYERFLETVHPADRHYVVDAVDAALADYRVSYDVDHRVLRADGTIRYVREFGRVERNSAGEPILMVGIVMDVTDRKDALQALTLMDKAMQGINDSLLVVDLMARVIDCNDAFERTTGFSAAEVVGMRVKFGRCALNTIAKRRQIIEALRDRGEWEGDLWDTRKNGEHYPAEVSIKGIYDERGRPTHAVAVFRDVTAQRKHKIELEQLAFFDPLTGLPNRTKITSLLKERMEEAGSKIGVCLLDLDEFSLINTALGHRLGDRVLRAVATRLSHYQRTGDELGRFGGDEFVLIVNGVDSEGEVSDTLDVLFTELAAPYQIGSTELYVGASAGIALYPDDGNDPATLMTNAELALHDFRKAGRRGFRFFSDSMQASALRRRDIEARIHEGLRNQEFSVYYQPQLDVQTGWLVSAEALLRWNRPDGTSFSPAEFIPVAETSGLIVELGDWVLAEAIELAGKARLAGDVRIAVNLSARQFVEKNLAQRIKWQIEAADLPAECIELEVTESAAMIGLDNVANTLRELRDVGCSIAIDDFGTGYSSLSYLKRFPIDTLKVDQSFVRGVLESEEDAEMARAIVAMGKSLRLKVVAEGVESKAQLEFFKETGCDIVQGFYVSRPLKQDDFLAFLRDYPSAQVSA